MIIFLTTAGHTYTHEALSRMADGIPVRILAYPAVIAQPRLPLATYVFTDCDRLPVAGLMAAAALYRCLRAGGARVLNDPARIPSRFGLLRLLHERAVNGFNAYRYEERARPARWPVFLRTEGNHDAPVSDLLHSTEELDAAAERLVQAGTPLPLLLVVEYAAQPVQPGLFRKLSCYRIGDRCIAYSCVHEDQWLVKYGKTGIATPALYEDELRIAQDNPHGPAMHAVFEAAGVSYGRVDFGLVDGRPQVYEINTNPHIAFPTEHPSPFRLQTYAVTKASYLAALAEIDTVASGEIAIESPVLAPYQAEAAARRSIRRASNLAR